ncbi:hypothetical protein GYMLUDRAFT_64926 [Collybiopsis luxurians FD-317 M1]|uniref:Uncharacterized protein n=1 Tax=Collybiopsis luxurians FD-317 M1 TaxID=944289 RepID=A0A0D0C922_9AGAR|nr:hypothetical protein GYMLUDRAFT_64926 [Collybiopsis luxurians FD-317 M1]
MKYAYSENTSGWFFTAPFQTREGWTTSLVEISLPCTNVKTQEKDALKVTIDGIIHWDLLEVMKEAYMDELASEFHLRGFPADVELGRMLTSIWKRKSSQPQGSQDAIWNQCQLWDCLSQAWVSVVQITVEIFMSKATQVCCPPFGLPKKVKDAYKEKFSVAPTEAIKTHLKHELEHAVWKLLLPPEFLHAYVHGIVVTGPDGIFRHLYPRFFTFSADYPEKVLLASIKNLGTHLCPQCTIRKDQVHELGTKHDMACCETLCRIDSKTHRQVIERARRKFFDKGTPITSDGVENLLRDGSYVPIHSLLAYLIL